MKSWAGCDLEHKGIIQATTITGLIFTCTSSNNARVNRAPSSFSYGLYIWTFWFVFVLECKINQSINQFIQNKCKMHAVHVHAMHRIIHYPRAVKVTIAKDERCNPYRLHACMRARHASWHPAARGNRIRTKGNTAEPDRFEYEPSPTQWQVFAHIATHRRCHDTCRRKSPPSTP